MNLVTVFTTLNPAEAELVCSRLQTAGLDASVANDISTITFGPPAAAAGGIQIRVPNTQAEDARALLSATVNAPTAAETGADDQ